MAVAAAEMRYVFRGGAMMARMPSRGACQLRQLLNGIAPPLARRGDGGRVPVDRDALATLDLGRSGDRGARLAGLGGVAVGTGAPRLRRSAESRPGDHATAC